MRVRGGSAAVKEVDEEDKSKELKQSSFLTLANVSYLLVGMTAMVFYQVHCSPRTPPGITSI